MRRSVTWLLPQQRNARLDFVPIATQILRYLRRCGDCTAAFEAKSNQNSSRFENEKCNNQSPGCRTYAHYAQIGTLIEVNWGGINELNSLKARSIASHHQLTRFTMPIATASNPPILRTRRTELHRVDCPPWPELQTWNGGGSRGSRRSLVIELFTVSRTVL